MQNTDITQEVLPSWDLTDLYKSVTDHDLEADMNKALQLAQSFQDKYQNKLHSLSGAQFAQALKELADLRELSDKPIIFAYLLHAADSSNSEHGKLIAKLQHQGADIAEPLTFFTLEWNGLDDNIADAILNSDEIKDYQHYLKSLSKYKPHELSEQEEILWNKLELTGSNSWTRLFDEIISKLNFSIQLPGESEPQAMTEEEVLSLLYNPCRETRIAASNSLTEGLATRKHEIAFIFNILLQDHDISGELRQYPHARSARNLSNEISDTAVDNLIEATENHKALTERFYKLKQRLLKLDVLHDYDRYAPVIFENIQPRQWTWQEASTFVKDAYQEFSPQFGDIVKEFYNKNWIDVDVREGKRGGAFSAGTVPSIHPYILLNFTNTDRDVATLAHELGHGVHQYLSRSVGYFNMDTPLTTAETASVFGEMLIFDKLLTETDCKKTKLHLIISKLDDIIATVYRQICMTKFEDKIHTHYRENGELTLDNFSEHWIDSNKSMFGNSIDWTSNYKSWWSYIPHFIHTPFYCYAYAFGLLLSITLYNEYKTTDNRAQFIENYTQVLSMGGSIDPVNLLKIMNIDLEDNKFWSNGFDLIENLIIQAEELENSL